MATRFLTEQQLARFHAFGFLAFPGLLARGKSVEAPAAQ